MNITCPNCAKKLKLNDKIKDSLQELDPGQTLRLPCPQCREELVLNARSLESSPLPSAIPVGTVINPPPVPDIDWLREGIFEESEAVEDVPQSMILMKPGEQRDKIIKAMETLSYKVNFANSSEEAIEKMQFANYANVVLHAGFEKGDLDTSLFHQFMRNMSMKKRRYIFYVLVGLEYSTLYDLQALSCSANLVVNDKEIPDFLTILRKAIPKYEELFGNIMAELSAYNG